MLLCLLLLGAAPPVFGPPETVGVVEQFTADRAAHWTGRAGGNVTFTIEAGYELPGVAGSLLRCEPKRTDPADREPPRNWFQVRCDDLPAGLVSADADGLRFLIACQQERQWWIQISLALADGAVYSKVIADAGFPAGRFVEHLVPFAEFIAEPGGPLDAARATTLRGIAVTTSTPGGALYLDRLTTYRRRRLTGWLDLVSNQPLTNLFDPGEPVHLSLRLGGVPPAAAAAVRLTVTNLDREVIAQTTVPLDGEPTVEVTPARHGYHEVTAHWLDAAGRALPGPSIVRAEGTQPAGLATFAVLPVTLEQSRANLARWGDGAVFGLHGDFHDLADRLGLVWRFGYSGWKWVEPERPERVAGLAPWAATALAEPVRTERYHLLPFRGNMGAEVPPWARRQDDGAPPFAEWDDYLAFVRDCVRIEKHRHPHQSPRVYGALWEANLNMPPYLAQPPEHTAEQLVELLRRTRGVVTAEDPGAWLMGPCPSVLNPDWFETMFRAGAMEHLDALETHAYLEGVLSPEENDIPGKLARIRALMRQYGGRELPIYVTEAGQPGVLGAEIIHRAQAERMIRAAIIHRGEGVRVYLPFYGVDYDRAGYWGFLFNLDVDTHPWDSRRLMPKPLCAAFAALVLAIEGSEPLGRRADLGEEIWAYAFRRDGAVTTAIWTPEETATLRLPLDGPAVLLDFEGHERPLTPVGGTVELRVGPAPIYVRAGG